MAKSPGSVLIYRTIETSCELLKSVKDNKFYFITLSLLTHSNLL